MDFSRETSQGYIVNHLARVFANALQRRIEPKGSSTGQFPLLLLLWEGDGITQTEIGKRLRIEQPTIANTLKRMERDGLITRDFDPEDRRRALIRLTDKARNFKNNLIADAHDINEAAIEGLTSEEIATFLKVAWHMARNLERKP